MLHFPDNSIRRQHGMSLPELMIAMTLGLLIMAGMATLFVESRRNFGQDELVARMQEDARFALAELSRELSMSGFWGPMLAGTLLGNDASADPTASDVFKYYDSPVLSADNIGGPQGFDWSPSLADARAGTDVISIRRVLGAKASDTSAATLAKLGIANAEEALDANSYYLQTNGTLGVMIRGNAAPSTSPAIPQPYEYWEYAPSIYYVRDWCRPGDGIPSLVKTYWDETGAITTDCMAQGIEDMQVEFGVDTNSDGFPDRYVNDVTLAAANTDGLAAVRVHLLARSADPIDGYDNTKTYNISNAPAYTPADSFLRRIYTTTVQSRNPTAARIITN